MGAGVSRSGKGKFALNFARVIGKKRTNDNESTNTIDLDVMYMSRPEVDDILSDSSQKIGSYILYEDIEKQKVSLAVKRTSGEVSHHFIHYYNDLYYFEDFPFPYLDSIVLYYTKHKFKDTKFTQQAFMEPYLSAGQKSIRKLAIPCNRRRHSSSTISNNSCKMMQHQCFRLVDPDKEWTMERNASNDNDPTTTKDVKFMPIDERLKSLTKSVPNLSLDFQYSAIAGAYGFCNPIDNYPESNGSSVCTSDSRRSNRVTIDSDSGYAVSVNDMINRFNRVKIKSRITPSFRMLNEDVYPIWRTCKTNDDNENRVLTTKL